MSDVIVLEDVVTDGWMRRIHLMSNEPFGPETLRAYGIPDGTARITKQIGVHHLTAEFGVRGLVQFPWQANILAVAWELRRGETVRQAIADAAVEYALKTGTDPRTAWIASLPKGVDDFTPVQVGGNTYVELIQAEACQPGFIVVL